MSILYMIW